MSNLESEEHKADRVASLQVKATQLKKLIEKAKPLKTFDAELFHRLVEKMTVQDGKKVLVTLLDGVEIECLTAE